MERTSKVGNLQRLYSVIAIVGDAHPAEAFFDHVDIDPAQENSARQETGTNIRAIGLGFTLAPAAQTGILDPLHKESAPHE